ncbi:hypothetical protein HG263_06895 [Pseudoalteromonas sp. JBTF-M23]|uniref:Tail assembly chaperone n=1 Tax=Pseudoalteromonas caenipelagi TaxID=2726988 RepID=A0A849VBP3_9GAMM|nr:hypothetical protein [Pseudoalteromonas caenipelagi]NOU50268.1 hypothetical protein [Pseudoalteromonas caenipelagi]
MNLKLLEQLENAVIKAPLNFDFGGVNFKFTAHIKMLTTEQIDELTVTQRAEDKALVKELLVGWEDFVDQGETVAFSQDVLVQLLKYGGIAGRLAAECINAQYRVQEKN